MTNDKMRVYITVDTETSMGGAWRNPAWAPLPLERSVFGKYRSQFYGIPLIMEILEQYGFRATFFTEVFCAYNVGHEEVAKVFEYIRERGHDAQLHLHPVQRFYRDFLAGKPRREVDYMFQLSVTEQRELIAEGVQMFREFTGKAPRAYRAGCYAASETTLRVLSENGIVIDSSYNLVHLEDSCGFATRPLNAPTMIEGVYEFPVTAFRVSGAGYKPLEISAVAVNEIMTTIRHMQRAGCRDITLCLHSFSLLKNLGIRQEHCRPDRFVIQRFRNLCSALAELKEEIEVRVFGDVDITSIPVPQPQVVPSLGWVRPAIRKFSQAVNRVPWI